MADQGLSIVIVNYNAPEMIARCLASLDSFLMNVQKEVIVVDNNSHTESLDRHQQQYPYLKVIRLQENLGFGQANNIGVANASGRMVLLLNSDTELIDASLVDAIRHFVSYPARTLWGIKILWPDRSFQNSFSREVSFLDFLLAYDPMSGFFMNTRRVRHHKYDGRPFPAIQEVDVVYGTAMLFYREDFLALHGFSPDFFMYFEDIEFCDRFRKQYGGHIYYYPFSALVHHVQGSFGKKSVNLMYLKSRYIYAFRKFGAWKMSLLILRDIPLLAAHYLYTRIYAGR